MSISSAGNYKSRRLVDYDDDNSNSGGEEVMSHRSQDKGELVYMNNLGKIFR